MLKPVTRQLIHPPCLTTQHLSIILASLVKLWNESGTKRGRIADSHAFLSVHRDM